MSPAVTKRSHEVGCIVISRDELEELAELERQYADATESVNLVEKALKAARMGLAEKVLGVMADTFRTLDPEHVEKLMAARRDRGLWKPARGAPPFVFLKTSSGRYPAWKSVFIAEHGEAAAEKIAAETPTTYSYRVDVAL